MPSSPDLPGSEDRRVLPPRPQMPRDEDCCRSDCVNCVFNLYERELDRWEQAAAELRADRP